MKTFEIEIKTGNDAFSPTSEQESFELARILRNLAKDLESCQFDRFSIAQTLYDYNGNSVGIVRFFTNQGENLSP